MAAQECDAACRSPTQESMESECGVLMRYYGARSLVRRAPTKLMIQVTLYKKGFETTRRNTNSNSSSRSAKLRVKISKRNLLVDNTARSLHCCLILTEFRVFFSVALVPNRHPVS